MDIIKTTAGMDEIAQLLAAGQPIVIAEIGLGTGVWTATTAATTLVAEFKRLPITTDKTSAQTVHLTATDASEDEYTANEVGIYLQSGTLLAIVADEQPITGKAARTTALFAIDLPLPENAAASVVIGGSNFKLPQGTETVAGVLRITSQFVEEHGVAASAAAVKTAKDAADSAKQLSDESLVARKLKSPVSIGGVSFDGAANINLPGVNAAGNQNTSGNAATATKLATARTLTVAGAMDGSATFDGSANATITVRKKVGEFYIQFPGGSAPSTLFGGTWTARFESEGIFFRTPGNNALAFNGGIQTDEYREHTHNIRTWAQSGSDGNGRVSSLATGNWERTQSITEVSGGVETRPRNRTIRVWELIAI